MTTYSIYLARLIIVFLITHYFIPATSQTVVKFVTTDHPDENWSQVTFFETPKPFCKSILSNSVFNASDFIGRYYYILEPTKAFKFSLIINQERGKIISTSFDVEKFVDDTIVIHYNDLIRLAEKRSIEINRQREISNLFPHKKFKRKYAKFPGFGLSEKKLERSIRDGSIFNFGQDFAFKVSQSYPINKDSVQIIWHKNILSSHLSKFKELRIDYLKKAESTGIAIPTSVFEWEWHVMQEVREIAGNVQEFRDKVMRAFESARLHDADHYSTQIAFWLSYFFVKVHGFEEENPGSEMISMTYLQNQIDKVPDGLLKQGYSQFLQNHNNNLSLFNDAVELLDKGGEIVNLFSDLTTDIVILDFWATWCRPCIKAFPSLQAFHSQNPDKVSLLSVSVDDNFSAFSNWLNKNHENYPWAFLYSGKAHWILAHLNVRAFPSYYVVHTETQQIHGPYHFLDQVVAVAQQYRKDIIYTTK